MNSPLLFIPSALCLVVILMGGLLVVVAATLVLKRTRTAPAPTCRDGHEPPIIGSVQGSAAASGHYSVWLKCALGLGLLLVLIGLAGLWAVGFSIGLTGDSPREWSDGRAPELEGLIRKHGVPFINQGTSVGMAVAVVSPSNATVMAFGRAALWSGAPIRGDSLFEIGSITKTFTGLALERACEQGTVRLDQSVQELLPAGVELPDAARAVTLRHLTTHTSGFPRLPANMSPFASLGMVLFGSDPYGDYTEKDLLEALRTVKLQSKPGTKAEYSNFGMMLLGYLLAKKANLALDTLIKENICRPLGMHDTGLAMAPGQRKRSTQGYRALLRCGPVLLALRSSPWFKADNLAGAGGLRSTGNDMLKYLYANMRPETQTLGRALAQSHRELFRENERTAFGMNWVRLRHKQFQPALICHDGGTGGFCSFIAFTEDGRVGVMILSNTSASVTSLAIDLLDDLNQQFRRER